LARGGAGPAQYDVGLSWIEGEDLAWRRGIGASAVGPILLDDRVVIASGPGEKRLFRVENLFRAEKPKEKNDALPAIDGAAPF